jgi:Flp pilus assembly protein TadB
MTTTTIILIALLCLCLLGLGLVFTYLFRTEPDQRLATLTRSNKPGSRVETVKKNSERQKISNIEIEDVQRRMGKDSVGTKSLDTEELKLFRAGFLTRTDREKFYFKKRISIIIGPVIAFVVLFLIGNIQLAIAGIAVGVLCGLLYPQASLDKKIRKREEEYMYYLPLVIEQISIGVSSALDIGPCITYVVEMAHERGTHNAVTELLMQVQKLMKAGMALDEALNDVGEVVGMNEIKNSFMFLSQCAKHGGEISKQLQELSESVTLARQMQIEAKITALPTRATGALALVFIGFFGMLLAGLLVRLSEGMS